MTRASVKRGTPELALLVGAARSGTTLTRLLLDAHPEVGCPAEAGVPALMAHMTRVWATVLAEEQVLPHRDPGVPHEAPAAIGPADAGPPAGEAALSISSEASDWIRSTVRTVTERYCAPRGKRVYVDKSLDSVFHLPVVSQLLPEIRVVMIFRHVMDTVASGIEASPWGFRGYGYAPYVAASPGNAVAALASYWLDHVARALKWAEERPEACYRVRYEDLVLRPKETVANIQRFLGVTMDLTVLDTAFQRPAPRGPGDYKVEFTSGVHQESVGRGKRVPVAMLPPSLMARLNDQLDALGYEGLDRGWNTAERAIDAGGRGLWAEQLDQLMRRAGNFGCETALSSFAVVAEDHHALRWVIDIERETVEQGDGQVDAVLTGTAEDLVLMLTGEVNTGVLLRSGRVRHAVGDEHVASGTDLVREMTALVAMLRSSEA